MTRREHNVSAVTSVRSNDTKTGFDIDAVDEDRRGITESIVARMRRAGGTAEIISSEGTGTEVHLRTGTP